MHPKNTPTLLKEIYARHGLAAGEVDPEAGAETAEIAMWGAVLVGAVLAIGTALEALGLGIVDYISRQLGVG